MLVTMISLELAYQQLINRTVEDMKAAFSPSSIIQEEVSYDPTHFVVPGLIDVEVVYHNNDDPYGLQAVVDNPNTACQFDYYNGCTFIADHSDQKFSTLTSVTVGETAYWQGKEYEAIYVYDGYITYPYRQMYLSDGQEPQDVWSLWTYTCTGTSTRRLVAWNEKPIN